MTPKGFTLIEVLIVVVIIAVLASLILPRFMGQSERAVIGEAQQMLGAIRRGQIRWQDMTGQAANVISPIATCGNSIDCQDTREEWAAIGVTPPVLGTGSYDYDCEGTTCTAVRAGGGRYDSAVIAISVPSGLWACFNGYVKINTDGAGGNSTRGCVPE